MEGAKSLLVSKTFWGTVVALLASIANATGAVSIDAAMQGEINSVIAEIGAVGGAIVAIYGRVAASKKIK